MVDQWTVTATTEKRKILIIVSGSWFGGHCQVNGKISVRSSAAEREAYIEELKEHVRAFRRSA